MLHVGGREHIRINSFLLLKLFGEMDCSTGSRTWWQWLDGWTRHHLGLSSGAVLRRVLGLCLILLSVPLLTAWRFVPFKMEKVENISADGAGSFIGSWEILQNAISFKLSIAFIAFVGVAAVNVTFVLVTPGTSKTNLLITIQSVLSGFTLMFVTLNLDKVADVLLAYLVEMCLVHLLIDATQFLNLGSDIIFTMISIFGFISTNLLATASQDSYSELTRLNFIYTIFVFLCIGVGSAVYSIFFPRRVGDRREKFGRCLGVVVSMIQISFCCATAEIANHIEGCPDFFRKAFMFTTFGVYLVTNVTSVLEIFK